MSVEEFYRDVKKFMGWGWKGHLKRKSRPKKHTVSKFWTWFDKEIRK